MIRERLTKRANKNIKAEDVKDGLFPGDVGNPERTQRYRKMDQYHTFEPTLNHWEPDMRHEWKDNPREETGHGIPKMAKIYMAAKKATQLAMMLLGDDADEKTLELQARDFMRMGSKSLNASIKRWAENQDEIVEEEAPVEAEEVCEKKAEEETVEAEEETVEAEEEEIIEDETVEAEEEEIIEDETVEADEDEVEVDEAIIPADINFDDSGDEEALADEELQNIFEGGESDDNDVAQVEETQIASKKTGIKRLAGQPKLCRVASKKDADELGCLWSKWESPNIR